MISIAKGDKIEAIDGRMFECFGFHSIKYRHREGKLEVLVLAREYGKEYIKMGVARVYNAPVYTGFEISDWDGGMVKAGKLNIRLEKVTRFNKAWGVDFDHCQMTVDPCGLTAVDVLTRDDLIRAYSLPSKV